MFQSRVKTFTAAAFGLLLLGAADSAHATCKTSPSATIPLPKTSIACLDETDVKLDKPVITWSCTKKNTITGVVIETNGEPVNIPVVKNVAWLPVGEHLIQWTVTDNLGNYTIVYAEATVEPGILGVSSLKFNDRAHTDALVASLDYSEIGVDAYTGTLLSEGDVFLRERATIYGDMLTMGGLTVQNDTLVTGTTGTGLSSVGLPWINLFLDPIYPGTTDQVVNNGAVVHLPPGAYGAITVNSGGTLVLEAGDYGMTTFILDTGAFIEFDADTKLYPSTDFIWRGEALNGDPLFVGQGEGTAHIENDFYGYVLVPHGTIQLASGGYYFKGLFRADILEVMEDADLTCYSF
jgi:hypothetical protein